MVCLDARGVQDARVPAGDGTEEAYASVKNRPMLESKEAYDSVKRGLL